ncbi:MAG TPA: leucine-rich repeat domain-containing protein, partial [Propionicimonas sp.]
MTTSSVVRGRRWLAVVVAGVTLAGAVSLSAAPGRADAAVAIPDARFHDCLDRNLGKADGVDISAAELESITQVYCDDSGIADITGARYLSSLSDLSLAGNDVSSISELKDLSTLAYLDLSRNRLSSIEGVYGLTNLKELRLSSNSITSIEGLANIKDPDLIDVSSNKIADLSPLKDFTGTTVYADGEKPMLAVVVDKTTSAGIKGRSGEPITHLTKTESWASLSIVGAEIRAAQAGVYDLDFAEQKCSSYECAYSFNGTMTVVAAVEFTAAPAPTISGKAAIGETLTAHVSNWSPLQLDWTYQWYRNDVAIPGAVGSTYKVTAADAGWRLKVALTGVLDGYASVSSQTIDIPGIAFTKATRPKITGTATVGKVLTAIVSGWSPTPDTWTYQWYRNSRVISGAVAATHTLVGSDAGTRITVKVTGIKPGYRPTSQTSSATRKVSVGTFDTDEPTIAGVAQV